MATGIICVYPSDPAVSDADYVLNPGARSRLLHFTGLCRARKNGESLGSNITDAS